MDRTLKNPIAWKTCTVIEDGIATERCFRSEYSGQQYRVTKRKADVEIMCIEQVYSLDEPSWPSIVSLPAEAGGEIHIITPFSELEFALVVTVSYSMKHCFFTRGRFDNWEHYYPAFQLMERDSIAKSLTNLHARRTSSELPPLASAP